MENNDNGRGIFYGVIGVATLVVAIIGATFAYFSASAAANNAIEVGTTTVTLRMENEKRNFRTDMIPVDSDNEYFKLYPGLISTTEKTNGTVGKGTCSDDDGNAICGIYQFTIKNPSETVSQTVYGSMTVVESGFTNMWYAVFKGAADTIEASDDKFNVNASTQNTAVIDENGDEVEDGTLIIAKKVFEAAEEPDDWSDWTEQTLGPGDSQTYTVVVWLEDNGDQKAEQGQTMTAAIKFDTGSGSGITGNLSAAS